MNFDLNTISFICPKLLSRSEKSLRLKYFFCFNFTSSSFDAAVENWTLQISWNYFCIYFKNIEHETILKLCLAFREQVKVLKIKRWCFILLQFLMQGSRSRFVCGWKLIEGHSHNLTRDIYWSSDMEISIRAKYLM